MYSNNLHDDKNAIKYYLLAAKKKNLVAVVRLLEDYPEVNSDIHNDISLLQYPALLTLQKTAPTNANDALALSEHYLDTTDDKRALYWCKKAMSIGNASEVKEATFNIARLYYKKGQYKKAIVTFKSVQDMEYAVQNIAYIYEVIKDYPNAIKWYKKAWEKGYKDVGGDLGLLYEKTKAYPKALKWYKKAFDKGNLESGYSLVSLYKKLNETDNAIIWYKKLFEVESNESYKIEILYKIAFLYHKKGDDLTAAAYYIAPIDIRYVKKDALTFLKSTWKINEATIKKAYELQKTLVPNPYIGGID